MATNALLTSGIVTIQSFPNKLSRTYRIITRSVHEGFFKYRKETVVQDVFGMISTLTEFLTENGDQCYIENGKVFLRPHCKFRMADESTIDKFFNTVEELDQFVNDLLSKNPHIII